MNEFFSRFVESAQGMDFTGVVALLQVSWPVLSMAAAVIGLFFFASGLGNDLRKAAEGGGQPGGWSTGTLKLVVGTFLMSTPMMFSTLSTTFYGSETPIAWIDPTTGGGNLSDREILVFVTAAIVQLAGAVWIVKGLTRLPYVSQSKEPGGVSKVIMHVVGGVLTLNIVHTVGALWGLVGLPNPLAFIS